MRTHKEATTVTRELSPAMLGLLEIFDRDDIEVINQDLELVLEMILFNPEGDLGTPEREAIYTIWRLYRQTRSISAEAVAG